MFCLPNSPDKYDSWDQIIPFKGVRQGQVVGCLQLNVLPGPLGLP